MLSSLWVLTASQEYVLYWEKLALWSKSVFTCCANEAEASKATIANEANTFLTFMTFSLVTFIDRLRVGRITGERPNTSCRQSMLHRYCIFSGPFFGLRLR